jgi:hypothetical protein
VKRISPIWTILLLFLPAFGALHSQSEDADRVWLGSDWYFSADSPSVIDLTEFLPPFFRNEALLKRYLRDERFYQLRRHFDDTLAVDAIFDRAMMLADGDICHALLIAAFAVMDHRQLGLNVPLLGSLYLPLTTENDSLFRVRRTHLPKKLLADNPRASDKDKLQHFFGSAYIAYSTNSSVIAEIIGDLFEVGEDRFVLGGRDDPRDKMANAKGRAFGLGLLENEELLPSDVLWERP